MSIDFIFHFFVISNTYNTLVGAQEADFFLIFVNLWFLFHFKLSSRKEHTNIKYPD